jgi:biotin carboxyl carrier protein
MNKSQDSEKPSQIIEPLELDQPSVESTERMLSWAGLSFIRSPSSQLLYFSSIGVFVCLVVGILLSTRIRVEAVVHIDGNIVSSISARPVVAQKAGVISKILKSRNDLVVAGEDLFVVSNFEDRIPALKQELDEVRRIESEVNRGLAGRVLSPYGKIPESVLRSVNLLAREKVKEVANEIIESSYLEFNVTSPIRGKIGRVSAKVGDVVQRGAEIATIIPVGGVLVAALDMQTRDISQIERGQKVRYRLEAFPWQIYGELWGEITEIEELTRNIKGDDVNEREVYYRVYGTISLPDSNNPPNGVALKVFPGMRLTGAVVTGETSLASRAISSVFK